MGGPRFGPRFGPQLSSLPLLIVLCWATRGCRANADAKRLYHDLINGYSSLIRPVGNNSDRLTVKMGLRLSQLIDVVSEPSIDRCRGLPSARALLASDTPAASFSEPSLGETLGETGEAPDGRGWR